MKPGDAQLRSEGDALADETLMQHFVQGDAHAFDALFARHAPAVRGYLRQLTRSQAAADDLTQQTFLSVVRSRGRFQQGARFKPWLYAIATNTARDLRRRNHGEELSETGALPEEAADPAMQADSGLERQVMKALDKLPDAQREAILLHRFEGLSFSEIAVVAGVTESAVKVRAHRGYERLRELLKGLWEASR